MSLKNLQTKIGVVADGAFGPGTMKKAMEFYELTPERAAHFFGQTAHETGEFKIFTENLNYSARGLVTTFGRYFINEATAKPFERNPEKIANRVYAGRMGNGLSTSGDGYKFRGRGALQLTGKENYKGFSVYLDEPEIMTNPDLVSTTYSFESALYFFERNRLWSICDQGVNNTTILTLTKRINGGTIGLDDRVLKTKKYYEYVK